MLWQIKRLQCVTWQKMNPKIKTTMTGKEYLAYCKYKDERTKGLNKDMSAHFSKHWKKYATFAAILCFFALVDGFIAGTRQQTPFTLNEEWLLAFAIVTIGISWVIHGVGFVLVKR